MSGALLTSLINVITEILKARDFVVTEREGHLIAKKGDHEIVFCLVSKEDDRLVRSFLERFKDSNAKKVIATLCDLPDSVGMSRIERRSSVRSEGRGSRR